MTALDVDLSNFNSHAHVERDYTRDDIANKLIYFNSHAHVERDELENQGYYDNPISTHTLTWSVTE